MIRIERAKVGSTATTLAGDKIPCRGWLVIIGRRYFIITTYKTRPVGDIGEHT